MESKYGLLKWIVNQTERGLQSAFLELIIFEQIMDWKISKRFFQPNPSIVTQIITITGKLPVFRFLHISMFNWIVMDVIKTRPKITFASNTCIPIAIPNVSSSHFVHRIQFIRSSPIESFHKNAEIRSSLRKKQKVIMIRKHDPRRHFGFKFCNQTFEYAYP